MPPPHVHSRFRFICVCFFSTFQTHTLSKPENAVDFMDSLAIDNLKCEKAKAFKNYRRQQTLKQVMRVFNFLLALFLFCRSSLLPIITDFWSRFYCETMSILSNSIYVFILGNAIMVFIYILTLQDCNHTTLSDDVYYRYFCQDDHFASTGDRAKSVPESKSLLKTDSGVEPPEPLDKQIIIMKFPPEKKGGSFSGKYLKEDSAAETETPKIGLAESKDVKDKFTENTVTTLRTVSSKEDIEKVSEVKRSYKRVQSESYEWRVVMNPGRRQLQRMNTDSQIQSQLARYEDGPSSKTQRRLRCVEDLSNEEFNRTIEDFIAKQKKKQREELDKAQYLALSQG